MRRFKTISRITLVIFIFATICLAVAPATATATPLSVADDPTAVFKFVVPPLPGRKTSPGGWGGLFVSFTTPVNTVTFAVNPVLNDCVDVAAAPVNADNQIGAAPADSWLWKCRNAYLLDPVEHQGLTVTMTVTSDDPIELLLDKIDAADPKNTFWWQKQDFNDDGTINFFRGARDADPPKLAAFPAPGPGSLLLLLSAIGVLYAILWWRKGQSVALCEGAQTWTSRLGRQ
jgi:hypothetical protein